jgi:thiamine-phosphate diphosphorylase
VSAVLRPPILCLVTDRRRARAGAGVRAAMDCLVDIVRAAADGRVDLVQIRERDLDGGPLVELVARALDAVRGTATRVVVNDRVDVAIAASAHGVHLRADSIPVAAARKLAPGLLIGRSVHSAADALSSEAAEADYYIAGTVFATASKPGGHPLLGPEGLAAIVKAASAPVLAIGGATLERLAEIREAGAAGVAGIGTFVDSSQDCDSHGVAQRAIELRRRFDTLGSAP